MLKRMRPERLVREDGAPLGGGSPLAEAGWVGDLERTEDRCRAYLEQLRWPAGVSCPRCDSRDTSRIEARRKFYCRACRYHFSVTSGTVLHGSHLPIWKWCLTVTLMIESEDGMPASQLVEILGVTYKTAWFAEHRVRAALQDGSGGLTVVPSHVSSDGTRARVFAKSLVGNYHQLELKYLPAYIAEIEWRSESRRNPDAFRDTMLRLLGSEPLAYDDLISGRRRGTRPHVPGEHVPPGEPQRQSAA
jgi:transposase-like protein